MAKHGAQTHQKAFETYYETRNWTRVAEAVGTAYATPFKWSYDDFRCPDGCPWHGWDELVKERDSALQKKLALVEQGNFDPIDHDKAVREGITNPDPAKRKAIAEYIRSDLERLTHLELLYAKLFYDMTGLAVEFSIAKAEGYDPEVLRSIYSTGTHIQSMEGGVRALQAIMDMIDKVKIRSGLVDEDGKPREQEGEEEGTKPLTLAELRDVRSQIQNTNPEQLAAMAAIIRADDEALESLQNVAN